MDSSSRCDGTQQLGEQTVTQQQLGRRDTAGASLAWARGSFTGGGPGGGPHDANRNRSAPDPSQLAATVRTYTTCETTAANDDNVWDTFKGIRKRHRSMLIARRTHSCMCYSMLLYLKKILYNAIYRRYISTAVHNRSRCCSMVSSRRRACCPFLAQPHPFDVVDKCGATSGHLLPCRHVRKCRSVQEGGIFAFRLIVHNRPCFYSPTFFPPKLSLHLECIHSGTSNPPALTCRKCRAADSRHLLPRARHLLRVLLCVVCASNRRYAKGRSRSLEVARARSLAVPSLSTVVGPIG